MTKKYALPLIIVLLIVISLTSCLTFFRATVHYMKPAELSIPTSIKTVAVIPTGVVKYHNLAYETMLEVFIQPAVQERYELIDRQNLDRIMQEQSLYNTEDFDDDTIVDLGGLAGANAVILAGYSNVGTSDRMATVTVSRKFEKKYIDEDGNEKTEYEYKDVNLDSRIRTYSFNMNLRMIDITRGTILYTDTISHEHELEIYDDDRPSLFSSLVSYNVGSRRNVKSNSSFPKIDKILTKFSKGFAEGFAKKVAPYAVQVQMAFETVPNDNINKSFIKFVKNELYEEAHSILVENLDYIAGLKKNQDRAKHYFNLGCTYEIMGDLEMSKEYYQKSVKEDPTNIHMESLKAIKDRIKDQERLEKQLEE